MTDQATLMGDGDGVRALPSDRALSPSATEPVPVSAPAGVTIPSAIVLVRADDPEKKPLLYACPKCGFAHSPNIYACRDELAHQTAREAAENCYSCREHNDCKYCGEQCPKNWLACEPCRLAKKLEAAQEVPDDGGPYCAFDGDTYYTELEDARDDGCEWVSPCHVTYPKIDGDSVLDVLMDDMHEDASVDDLDAVEPFLAAVTAFNEAQKCQSWFGDDKRKINVAEGIEARSGETRQGLDPKDESPVGSEADDAPTPSPPSSTPLQGTTP
jgi:hypothetical protein